MDLRSSSVRAPGARLLHGTLAGVILTAASFANPAGPLWQEDAPAVAVPEPEVIAIRAERVILSPGKELAGAIVLARAGRIVEVGPDVQIPDGATVLEGSVVCAGFMDPWSVAGVELTSAFSSSGAPSVMAADVIDPYGAGDILEELVAAGVVATRSQIASRAQVSGVDVVLSTATAEPVVGDASLSAALGVTRGGFGPSVPSVGGGQQLSAIGYGFATRSLDPVDRVGQIDKLVNQLVAGRKYGEDLAKYERDLAAWEEEIAEKEAKLEKDFKKAKKARDKKVKEAEEDGEELKEKKYKEDKRPRAPKLDADKAVFARVVNGEMPIVVTANRALEIRELLRLTEPFTRLRMILAGGTAALAVSDDLAARRIPVIVAPSPATKAGPVTELNPGLALAAELHDRGIEVLIGSGANTARTSRDLTLLAALAVGHGLDRDAALHAITHGPARAFDVADRMGSIGRGQQAELVVLSGDPLASSTQVLATVSGGRVAYRAEN